MRTTNCRCGRLLTGSRQGFTLVEALMALIIVGLAAAAIMFSTASNTCVNDAGSKRTEAVFLAQGLREWTLSLPFTDPDPGDQGNPPGPDGSEDPQYFVDDLDDLMNVSYTPPRDGMGSAVSGMPGWTETISLTWRNPDNFESVVSAGSTMAVYVEVSLVHRGRRVLDTGWLVID